MGTPILFSPENVRNVLVKLPSVAALLPDPALEGEPSDAFPGVLRKTQREVYRWIANTDYEHLADAVRHLERVHAAGCTFGSLLSTRDREQFVSLTAEVLVADDFLRRGYEVQTVQRSDQVRPLFDSEAMTFVDEVYQRADAFLFGRRTYELFAGYWGVREGAAVNESRSWVDADCSVDSWRLVPSAECRRRWL